MDVLEKSLYNGLISGVGMDGKSFFYTNAMQIRNSIQHKDMEASRSGWFPCSCCPTNVVRLIPSVTGYAYAQKSSNVYVNLFMSGTATLSVNNKQVKIEQQNNYPWEGSLIFKVSPKSPLAFTMLVRIPGWAQNKAIPSDLYAFEKNSDKKVEIKVNNKPVEYTIDKGYAVLSRTWKSGDVLSVDLPMEVRSVVANKNVKDDIGKVALQRGPLMYCAEWPDNNGKTGNIVLPAGSTFTTEFRGDLLNGVTVLKGESTAVIVDAAKNSISTIRQPFLAIPYYAWAHRGKGEMEVWFPEKITDVDIISK